jgi:hypothetical protein
VRGPGDGWIHRGAGRGGRCPRLIWLIARLNRIYCIVNRHVQDCEDATFRERVNFGRYGGIGRDFISPHNFVNRSSANNSDGQQRYGN